MSTPKPYKYFQVAKEMGVPNIILTGIEKKIKMEFPDDDEVYACHVLGKLRAMALDLCGDWSKCSLTDLEEDQCSGDFRQDNGPGPPMKSTIKRRHGP